LTVMVECFKRVLWRC